MPVIGRRHRRLASVLEDVRVERDVLISRGDARSPTADVFTPVELPPGPPLIVLHGAAGRREDLTQFSVALAGRGHLVMNASWRLPPHSASLATGIDTLHQAAAHARGRIDAPAIVVAWSDAAMVAVTAVQEIQSEVADIARLIVLGGYFGWRGDVPATLRTTAVEFFDNEDSTCWRSPFTDLARRPSTPVDVVVGDLDINRLHGTSFVHAAHEAGWPVALHVVDGCDHYDLVTPRLDGGARAVQTIAELAGHRAGGSPAPRSRRAVRSR